MPPPLGRMDPHLRGVRPSRVDERKEVQSGQRGLTLTVMIKTHLRLLNLNYCNLAIASAVRTSYLLETDVSAASSTTRHVSR